MEKFKKTLFAVAMLTSFSSFAAQELASDKANSLQAFKEISIRGQYYSPTEYARAISKAADKEGAPYFYITSVNVYPGNESLRVIYANLYKADASEKSQDETLRSFRGVFEYPKRVAVKLEPYDIIRIRGYFPTQNQLNNAVAKEASSKGAYAYYIDRLFDMNNSGNVQVTAYIFKKDAAERKIQPDDAIPYDSEAGQLALAQGGEAAMQVERPGYYSSSAFNEQFYSEKFNNKEVKDVVADEKSQTNSVATKETTSSTADTAQTKSIIPQQKSSRYSVTLPDGTKVEELNDATAAKMVPFDTIKFRGYYPTAQQVSYTAAKKAAEKGAKYYHISRIAQESGPNKTIYVELYR